MALLSLDMIREIRGVADAYTARERERLGASVPRHDQGTRVVEFNRSGMDSNDKR